MLAHRRCTSRSDMNRKSRNRTREDHTVKSFPMAAIAIPLTALLAASSVWAQGQTISLAAATSGEVLIAGGSGGDTAAAELFDPVSKTFSSVGDMLFAR